VFEPALDPTTGVVYDTAYEVDADGGTGSLASVDAQGHLDPAVADLFFHAVVLADEQFGDARATWGYDVELLWRTEHPMDQDPEYEGTDSGGWTYHYTTEERPGAMAVTRWQPTWLRLTKAGEPLLCVNHPNETAWASVPEHRVIVDHPDEVVDGYVHFCKPCADDFWLREQRTNDAARAEAAA